MKELLSEIHPTEHSVCRCPGLVGHTILWYRPAPGSYRLRIITLLFADVLDIALAERDTHIARAYLAYTTANYVVGVGRAFLSCHLVRLSVVGSVCCTPRHAAALAVPPSAPAPPPAGMRAGSMLWK